MRSSVRFEGIGSPGAGMSAILCVERSQIFACGGMGKAAVLVLTGKRSAKSATYQGHFYSGTICPVVASLRAAASFTAGL